MQGWGPIWLDWVLVGVRLNVRSNNIYGKFLKKISFHQKMPKINMLMSYFFGILYGFMKKYLFWLRTVQNLKKKPSIWIKMCNILIGEWKKLSGILILSYRLPNILVDISYFVCNADIKKGFNYNFTGFKCFLTQNILFMVVTLKTWNW